MDEKEQQITTKPINSILKPNNRCWNFFKVQKDHVFNSTKAIRIAIKNINRKGYSELSDLTNILEALDIIENQMPIDKEE